MPNQPSSPSVRLNYTRRSSHDEEILARVGQFLGGGCSAIGTLDPNGRAWNARSGSRSSSTPTSERTYERRTTGSTSCRTSAVADSGRCRRGGACCTVTDTPLGVHPDG